MGHNDAEENANFSIKEKISRIKMACVRAEFEFNGNLADVNSDSHLISVLGLLDEVPSSTSEDARKAFDGPMSGVINSPSSSYIMERLHPYAMRAPEDLDLASDPGVRCAVTKLRLLAGF
jgi:hypothetical protein